MTLQGWGELSRIGTWGFLKSRVDRVSVNRAGGISAIHTPLVEQRIARIKCPIES